MRQLQTELDKEEQNRAVVAALDAARLAQTASAPNKKRFALEHAVPLFREAFRAYGLPAGEGDPTAAAARIRERPAPVREALLAALDEWDDLAGNPKTQINEPHREWLRAVLDGADPEDGWGAQVRAARRETDPAKRRELLEALATSADVRKIPAAALVRLAGQLRLPQQVALLRRTQQQYPGDFWANEVLGWVLQSMAHEPDEAVRFLTAAAALRPESAGSRINLGLALMDNRRFDEAIACYRKAIEIDPTLAVAHSDLGIALLDKGETDLAIASFDKAIELDPNDAMAYDGLGDAQAEKGQLEGAVASYRKAIEIEPEFAMAHNSLGVALLRKGQIDLAIASYHKAIESDPKFALAHGNLGNALLRKGRFDEAIAGFREAVEINPKLAETYGKLGVALREAAKLDPDGDLAHVQIGLALLQAGEIDVAVTEFRKALVLKPDLAAIHYYHGLALAAMGKLDDAIAAHRVAVRLDDAHVGEAIFALGDLLRRLARYDEAIDTLRRAADLARAEGKPDQVRRADVAIERVSQMKAIVARSPDFIGGAFRSGDGAKELTPDIFRYDVKRYAQAVRFYALAFRADPKLADDPRAWHRYNAACYAALAAAARGERGKLSEQDRAGLRKQALDWLRADLVAWGKGVADDSGGASALVPATIKHWQQDSDLTGIREEAALAKLPAEERAAFAKLWKDVAALLEKATATAAKETDP